MVPDVVADRVGEEITRIAARHDELAQAGGGDLELGDRMDEGPASRPLVQVMGALRGALIQQLAQRAVARR